MQVAWTRIALSPGVGVLIAMGSAVALGQDDMGKSSWTESSQPGIIRGELIYEKASFPQCHASTIVQTTSGKLVAAWFGGKHERNPDVGIWLSRLEDDTWSTPVEVVNGVEDTETRYPCWNPVLFQTDGPLLLFYKVGPSPSEWWGMVTMSTDDGRTWSTARQLGDGFLGPVKNKPISLSDSQVLCGSSSEHAGWRVHFELIADRGRRWTLVGPVNDGKEFGAIQPTLLVHRRGVQKDREGGGVRIQALCRSQQNRIVETWSDDAGQTWSKMKATSLPNPNAGFDGVTLKDGRQLLVYNHTFRRGPSPKGREMLNVAVSEDGKNWKAAAVLENEPGEFSYPAVIQTSDGLVHTTYTWHRRRVKHVIIDPAKLDLREIHEGIWPK